jgi:putative DNA primase/helicase
MGGFMSDRNGEYDEGYPGEEGWSFEADGPESSGELYAGEMPGEMAAAENEYGEVVTGELGHGERIAAADLPADQSSAQILNAGDLAAQISARAGELMAAVQEVKEPPSGIFVTECLQSNERGDGLLFCYLHRDKYLLNVTPKDGEWYVWDQHVWAVDHFKKSLNAVEDCALEYQLQHDILDDEIVQKGIEKGKDGGWKIPLRDKFASRVDRLRTVAGASKVLTWASIVDDAHMSCRENEFNQNPWLLPVKNGVINLKTGELEAGRPADMMSKSLEIAYNPRASYGLWSKTISEIAGSEEVASFLKRALGYAITGNSHEQYIFVFIGPGRNGKGVLFNTIGEILGPFYHEINRAMLLEQRNEPSPAAASAHLYSLLNKRLIVGAETNKGQKIDAAAVKGLVGEDGITCRPLFGHEISFFPTHTLFLHTNHIPRGLTNDFAMLQRLLLIEFPYMYVDDVAAEQKKYPIQAEKFRQKNPHLKEALRAEQQGILTWLVEGCLEWQRDGLSPPASILDSVAALAKKEDYIGEFVTDCLTFIPGTDQKLRVKAMYDAFRWWWAQNQDSREQRVPALRTLNQELRDRGYQIEKRGGLYHLFDAIISFEVAEDVAAFVAKGGKS